MAWRPNLILRPALVLVALLAGAGGAAAQIVLPGAQVPAAAGEASAPNPAVGRRAGRAPGAGRAGPPACRQGRRRGGDRQPGAEAQRPGRAAAGRARLADRAEGRRRARGDAHLGPGGDLRGAGRGAGLADGPRPAGGPGALRARGPGLPDRRRPRRRRPLGARFRAGLSRRGGRLPDRSARPMGARARRARRPARPIEQDRSQADRAVRENYKALAQRAQPHDVRTVVSEQAAFSSERETPAAPTPARRSTGSAMPALPRRGRRSSPRDSASSRLPPRRAPARRAARRRSRSGRRRPCFRASSNSANAGSVLGACGRVIPKRQPSRRRGPPPSPGSPACGSSPSDSR